MAEWVSILAVAVGVCLITTLNLALRHVSFSRLAKCLSDRGRDKWLDAYRASEERFVLATATLRTWLSLALVLLVTHGIHHAWPETALWTRYVVIFLVSMSLIAVVGVAVPQAIAKYLAVGVLSAPSVLPIITFIDFVTWPVTCVLRALDVIVRRLAAVPQTDEQTETEQIEQDVLDAVEEAEMQGAVDETEKAMIKSVMELDEATAEEIMTPRTDIIGTEKSTTLSELKSLIKKEGHSRIPVYDGTIDKVLGLVYAKDLLHVAETDASFNLVDHLRSVSFVPQTKPVRDLLTEFQSGKTHVAIVGDEYGGTAGLVTIEDILEELVGEIADEFEPPEPQPIVRLNDHAIEVDSKVHVDEINDLLNLHIPEEEDYETIGGFVFSTLGKIPATGEELMHDDVKITILEAEERRIHRLRIEIKAAG